MSCRREKHPCDECTDCVLRYKTDLPMAVTEACQSCFYVQGKKNEMYKIVV
jgi:hypothetical protein